jgi:phosphoribosylformylglycinamidine synthase
VSQWFKNDGDVVLLLGETHDEIGGSEYVRVIHHREQGIPPLLSLETERALHTCLLRAIEAGFVCSAHDCSEGGLAIAIAESCLSRSQGPIGASIALTPDIPDMRIDAFLFGETQSRAIVTVEQRNVSEVQSLAQAAGVPVRMIGTVGGQHLRIGPPDLEVPWIDVDVNAMYNAWMRKQ